MKHTLQRVARRFSTVLVVGLVLAGCVLPGQAFAFNRNNLMDDYVFNQENSMSAAQIDAFLNSKNSCISPNSGFSSRDPVGYSPSGGFQYGQNVTAGTVIAHAAQVYDLNPQVLLATLQKEQSLVGSTSCSTYTLSKSMGYGCPDSGGSYDYSNVNLYTRNGTTFTSVDDTCVNSASKAGFSQQIIYAAWLFKFGQQRSFGNTSWAIITGSWDNSDDLSSCYGGPMTQGSFKTCPNGPTSYFDGYRTIDGVAVHIDTGATAALYWYTPHFHGNQNFVAIFTNYFGGTTGPEYAWSFESLTLYADAARTQRISNPDHSVYVAGGQKFYAQLKARNAGRFTWTGTNMRVAVSGPRSRTSAFQNADWITRDRAGAMVEAATKANEVATFNFSLTAPTALDAYNERFAMVYDGVSWLHGPELYIPITVTNSVPLGSSEDRLNAENIIRPGERLLSKDLNSVLTLLPDGDVVLYRDHRTVWKTNTAGSGGDRLLMQADGNLVLYRPNGQPVWASNTNGAGPSTHLVLQTDGNLVLYNNSGAVWGSMTQRSGDPTLRAISIMQNGERLLVGQALITPNRAYKLIMQTDGNLVLYKTDGTPVWGTGTHGSGAIRAYMQPDGNLVLYKLDGRPVWGSGTNGRGSSTRLVFQNDRNLVLYNDFGPVWGSGTNL